MYSIIQLLACGKGQTATFTNTYKDHALTGNFADFRECHIAPDWLLVYRIENAQLVLTLTRTGSHSDLFK